MPSVQYQETTYQHANRLSVAIYFARTRRRVLAAKLEGRKVPIVWPRQLYQATSDELMATLAVKTQSQEPDGCEETLWLIPTTTPLTVDRARGQINLRRYRKRSAADMPAGRKQEPLPYGYRWTTKKTIVPDPESYRTLQLAFGRITRAIENGIASPWDAIAAELNAVTPNATRLNPWTAKDVRALTHEPRYAGYIRTNHMGLGDDVEPDVAIEQPLVDMPIFLQAAHLGHRTIPYWLESLEMMWFADPARQQHTLQSKLIANNRDDPSDNDRLLRLLMDRDP